MWILQPASEVVVFFISVVPLVLRTFLTLVTGCMRMQRPRFVLNQVHLLVLLAHQVLRVTWQEEKHSYDPLILILVAYMYFVATFPPTDYHDEATRLLFILGCCVAVFYLWRIYLLFITLRAYSKHLVSKKKRRFIDCRAGFDLDLSFINPQVIAMGFPTERLLEQQFRNPMDQVKTFFHTRYPGHHKVYNLCSERTYSQKSFENECHDVRFPDHNPCPLADLRTICEDMENFLRQDRVRNVIAVHCKAGKGRTGLVVSSFLLHVRKCSQAVDALNLFGEKRTYDGKGVTIPSQIRYVHHYEAVVREGKIRDPVWLRLLHVEVKPEPAVRWNFQLLTHKAGVIFDSTVEDSLPPLLKEDVKVVFFEGKEKLFQLWVHTAYDPRKTAWTPSRGTQQDGFTVVWPSEVVADGQRRRSESEVVEEDYCAVTLERMQLDGPHKKKKKSAKEDKSSKLEQVCLLFARASPEEVQAAQFELERQEAQRRREEEAWKAEVQRKMRKTTVAGATAREEAEDAAMEDYDHLEFDTDHDEILDTICRGYMVRQRGSCSRPQQRFCELFTSGRMHISGGNGPFLDTFDTLVVDLTQGAENVLQEVDDPERQSSAWRVRNPHSKCWELLRVADPSEAVRWEQGLADAVRLGRAAKDPMTYFAGFFWKMNSDQDSLPIPGSFEMENWRIRLFVLRSDGNMMVYSHKTRLEEVFCNFTTGCELTPLPVCWRGLEHIVLFQLTISGKRRTLAAPHEEFEAFAMRVAAFQRSSG